MFKKESKQDLYSTKFLLNKAFGSKLEFHDLQAMRIPYYNHLIIQNNFGHFSLLNKYCCIHCGVKIC